MSWWCGVAVLVAWVAAVLTVAKAIGYGAGRDEKSGRDGG